MRLNRWLVAAAISVLACLALGETARGWAVTLDVGSEYVALNDNLVELWLSRAPDDDAVFAPKSYGPHVDRGEGEVDILSDYIEQMFEKAGYTQVQIKRPEARWYHNGAGSVHCGTNVRREIPTSYDWWD